MVIRPSVLHCGTTHTQIHHVHNCRIAAAPLFTRRIMEIASIITLSHPRFCAEQLNCIVNITCMWWSTPIPEWVSPTTPSSTTTTLCTAEKYGYFSEASNQSLDPSHFVGTSAFFHKTCLGTLAHPSMFACSCRGHEQGNQHHKHRRQVCKNLCLARENHTENIKQTMAKVSFTKQPPGGNVPIAKKTNHRRRSRCTALCGGTELAKSFSQRAQSPQSVPPLWPHVQTRIIARSPNMAR